MSATECRTIILDAMALLDGEATASTGAEIEAHTAQCTQCAAELRQLGFSHVALSRVYRATVATDVWPAVAQRLTSGETSRASGAIVAICSVLVLWRTFEQAAVDPLALWSRVIAVGLGAALFVVLRQNPFRLESH